MVAPGAVNCWLLPRPIDAAAGVTVIAAGLVRVTVELAEPPGPVAVRMTVGEDGIVAGATYRPAVEIEPAEADQLVAPTEVNCCDMPRPTLAERGEIVCAARATRATDADADPFGPVAVTIADAEDGRVEGGVYRPEELIDPAVADQEVAPVEVNC